MSYLLEDEKKLCFELLIRKMKKQNLDFESHSGFLYWNEILYNSELFEKIVGMLDFCDFRYRSCSRQVLFMIMRLPCTCTALYCCVLWKMLLFINCFVVIKYAVFIWMLGFRWLMQVHGYKYWQDFRRSFSSCKLNEEWAYITTLLYWNWKRTFLYEIISSG